MEANHAGILRRFAQRRPQVMLEWDSAQSKVVAAPSQVGLSWNQAFTDATKLPPGSHPHPSLEDGFDIPEELLELPNLNDILSVETWETCLTESERDILSVYLPEGVDPESTVDALLTGENFHFGSPLQKWGESVCAGSMHPDALLRRELKLKQQRNAYAKSLGNYHGKMVHNLQKMKEVWEDCENPEDFLPQIQRSMMGGQTSRGTLMKNVLHPSKKASENVDSRKRQWDEIRVSIKDQEKDMSTRPKAKKRKVNKSSEEGSKQLKMKLPEGETANVKMMVSEEGPKRLKIRSTVDEKDISIRPKTKGGKVILPEEGAKILKMKTSEDGTKRLKFNQPEEGTKGLKVKPAEEGTKRLKVKPEGGANRPEINPSEQGPKRLHMKPLEEGRRRLKINPSEVATKRQQSKPSEEGTKRLEIKVSDEGTKGSVIKPSNEGTKRLKIKSAGDGTKRPPSVDGMKKLQTKPSVQENDMPARPKAKRGKPKISEEGMKSLESKEAESGAKKLQIKVWDAGRKTLQIKPLEEERGPPSRPRAKTPKVKPLQEEEAKRPKSKPSEEGPKRLRIKASQEGAKIRKSNPSEEGVTTLKIKPLGDGGKRPKVKPSKEAAERLKMKPLEEGSDLPARPKGKRRKVNPPQQGTKRLQIKPAEGGQEEFDLANSDFEAEWFNKYVRVTIGPISSQKLAKAIQSVKVTTKMFEDVKRRSEAGEEVHLDTLDPTEGRSSSTQASKKPGGSSGHDVELLQSFWQRVLLKDLPMVHASFMERKEHQQKLAISLASGCKNLRDNEVSNFERVQDDTWQSRGSASSIGGDSTPSEGEAWRPSGGGVFLSEGEDAPSGGEASSSGGEDSSSGGEGSQSGGEAFLSGDEPWPIGDEAVPNRDDAFPSEEEALPSGEDALSSGDETSRSGGEASPSEADLEEQKGVKFRTFT